MGQLIHPECIDEEMEAQGKKCPLCNEGHYMEILYTCRICGWTIDGVQEHKRDWENCTNELSFNQHKARFEFYRSKNPKYKWYKFRFCKREY